MQAFSSVTAFIAAAAGGAADARAAEILAGLAEDARLVIEAQAVPRAERPAWLRQRSGREWSPAWLAHVEQRAFVAVRRELQRRGLWRA